MKTKVELLSNEKGGAYWQWWASRMVDERYQVLVRKTINALL